MTSSTASLPILVLGCGVAGLAAARVFYANGARYRVFERQDGPGGLIRTDRLGDFLFDRAGHFLHPRSDTFRTVLAETGIRYRTFTRRSAVIIDDAIVPYPLQFNLWACERAFSSAVERELAEPSSAGRPGAGLREHFLDTWGATLTKRFFEPYLGKMWGRPLDDIPSSWGSRFVPAMDPDRVREGLARPVLNYGYNDSFIYPASGRIGDLGEALASRTQDSIELETEAVSIDSVEKTVTLACGRSVAYSRLVSTIPLNRLLELLGREADSPVLAHSGLLNIRVGFRGELLRRDHWYYLPDPSLAAFRAGLPGNFSDRVCPPGSASLSLECGLGQGPDLGPGPEAVARQTLDYLAGKQILAWDEIELVDSYLIRPSYVAHRMEVTPHLQRIRRELATEDIYLAGRYGAWDYMSIEDSYLSGLETAQMVLRDSSSLGMQQIG